jgi:hypothetical protein
VPSYAAVAALPSCCSINPELRGFKTNKLPSGNDVAGSAIFKKFIGAGRRLHQAAHPPVIVADGCPKAARKTTWAPLAHEPLGTLQTYAPGSSKSVSGEAPVRAHQHRWRWPPYDHSTARFVDLIPDFIPVLGLPMTWPCIWFSTTLKGEMEKFNEW